MTRPTLADSLVGLVDAVLPASADHAVRVTSLLVDVPVEVVLVAGEDGVPPALATHPRRWRLHTPFEPDPGRLRVTFATAHDEGADRG